MKKAYLILICLLLCGCAPSPGVPDQTETVRVVVEEGSGYKASSYVQDVMPGEDAVFYLTPEDGYTVQASSSGKYQLEAYGTGVKLTVPHAAYTVVITPEVRKSPVIFRYYANGGTRTDGGNPEGPLDVAVSDTHLRLNTSLGTDLFTREGYTLTGWNTKPDLTGRHIGLGSRVSPEEGAALYAEWAQWSAETLFSYYTEADQAIITGYSGSTECLVIPGSLGGCAVRSIASGAFSGCTAETIVFPESLRTVSPHAFQDAHLKELILYDSLVQISDDCFEGCADLSVLRINAAEEPVYSGTYYAVFQDKYDRLLSLKDQQKIVLFSGSSARFGYDSGMIDAAFPDYRVVNMGVFAYSNAVPQLLLIETCLQAKDILLLSPELDAAKRQFCTSDALDAPFFCMMECNYDAVASIDLRAVSGAFSAFREYLFNRKGMETRPYYLSPADFDEDRNPVTGPSYNVYGDYILYRPNAETEAPIYGLEVPYTENYYLKWIYLDPFNAFMRRFIKAGVRVYMTYSPRNRLAVSKDTTQASVAALDAYFKENIEIPIISDLSASLMSGIYFSGTDNHLSTEGVSIRTSEIIRDLRKALKEAENE